jgi:hypothetical protein
VEIYGPKVKILTLAFKSNFYPTSSFGCKNKVALAYDAKDSRN